MALALYAPGLGYYTNTRPKLGRLPDSGPGGASDFVTAPEMTPLFGQTLAVAVAEALQATGTDEVWEFGAGTGALAAQLIAALDALGQPLRRYTIVDLSGTLRLQQQQALAAHAARVHWASEPPEALQGVLVGNEVLDAMPVKLLARTGGVWHERGVALAKAGAAEDTNANGAAAVLDDDLPLTWADRPTPLRPPLEVVGPHDYLTELHPQAEAFVCTLAERLQRSARGGAAYFLDYGFPEAEYYHPQRHMGTLMCHQAHRADPDPLSQVGQKDITAHVNFTGVALAGQDAGLGVLGYTSQARFLMNCGLLERLAPASPAERGQAQKLMTEHEMGELFKVVGFCTGTPWAARGFALGDRCHTL